MIKVYENFDISRVGRVQSLLESNGIPTFLKNQFTSSVMGEVPFVEVCPQLFILDESDLEKAQELIAPELDTPVMAPDWQCTACGAEVEGVFSQCWSCGLTPAVG